MTRQTDSGMRLRGRIQQPLRYEDEDIHARKPYEKRKGTKPAFPELLEEQTMPFNPNHPPAAFPSLPLSLSQPHRTAPTPNHPEDCFIAPEPRTYSSVDVSRLTQRHVLSNGEDSAMSNDLAAGDGQGVDPFDKTFQPTLDEPITWNSLELAYQYRIFCALCKTTKEENVVSWLGLTEPQYVEMKDAVKWRQGFPITLTQFHDGQNTLANCMDPSLLMRYADLMVKVSHYELGSPLQLLRASIFLQHVQLPIKLLGTWVSDPLGSGQLVDATPLADCFPAMTVSAQQLQDLCLQAPRGIEPSLETNNIPANNDGKVPKPKVRRSIARPRKQKPTLLENMSSGSSPSPPPAQTIEVVIGPPPAQLLHVIDTSESTSESSEDYITVLKRWTQPLPRSIPDPNASVSAQLSQRLEEGAPAPLESQVTATPYVPVPSSSSTEDRSSGSMSLRRRSNLKETEAMSALRKDQDFWSDFRLITSPSRSATAAPRMPSPEKGPLLPDGEVKTPQLKLIIRDNGVARVETSASLSPSIPRGGKSLNNFAMPETIPQQISSATGPADAGPVSVPISTPQRPSMVFVEPTRAEDAFKQTMRPVDVPTSSPTRFGDASDFETKLIMPPVARPRTPDFQELGVFGSENDVSAYQTARSGREVAMKELSIQESAPQSPTPANDSAVQVSGLLGKSVPTIDDIVPSIEEDVEMPDATVSPEANTDTAPVSAPTQLFDTTERGRGLEIDIRKSPLRSRSVSPISDNEDFEEYHEWLRGERDHGPMPRNQKPDTSQESPELLATTSLANDHQADKPMELAAEQDDASPDGDNTATTDAQSLVVKLLVQVTDKDLEDNELARTGINFPHPGEEGDSEYEEPKPPKKQKQKITPTKPTTPTKVPSAKLNSAKTTKKPNSIKKGSVKKPPARLTAKRTTRAQSLAGDELTKTPAVDAFSAVPKLLVTPPSIEVIIPKASPSAATHKPLKDAAPRRSARLSSVESTDASDSSLSHPRKRRKIDAPLRAKPTPTSKLRQSLTPTASSRRSGANNRTAVKALRDEDGGLAQQSASEADSEGTTSVDGSSGKPRKKWTPKEYTKTRESSRLADAGVPNMKV